MKREDPTVAAARARRYGELRAAQRALCTSALPNRSSLSETLLQEARSGLRELAAERSEGAGARDAAARPSEIDELLDRAAVELRNLALATSFSQFRATLPHLRDSHADEVAALLDLCLPEAENASQARNLCEYMITLLATEKPAGKVLVRRDPAVVTRGVRELSERAAERSDAVIDHLEVLREAIAEISTPLELEEVREQLRSYKDKMGPEFWAPELLRALVEYNVAIQNRLEDAVEADRTLDSLDTLTTPSCRSEYTFTLPGIGEVPRVSALGLRPRSTTAPRRIEPPDANTGGSLPTAEQLPVPRARPKRATRETAPEPLAETPAAEPAPSDARCREAIAELESGLAARITQGSPGRGPASEALMRLDLTLLSRWERMAFAAGSDAADAPVLRATVLAGLILRHLDGIAASLAHMGLPRTYIETTWLDEVGSGMQQAIAQALADDSYARAKELAETKSKFLYASVEEQIRDGKRSNPPAATNAPSEQRAPVSHRHRRSESASPVRPTAHSRRAVALVAALVIAGLALIAYQNWQPDSGRSAQMVAPGALRELSPHLESAYRDGFGYGPRFFGTLSQSWDSQPPTRRRAAALDLAKRLGTFGISEALLFDAHRRVRVHYRDGELLVPPAPGDAPGTTTD